MSNRDLEVAVRSYKTNDEYTLNTYTFAEACAANNKLEYLRNIDIVLDTLNTIRSFKTELNEIDKVVQNLSEEARQSYLNAVDKILPSMESLTNGDKNINGNFDPTFSVNDAFINPVRYANPSGIKFLKAVSDNLWQLHRVKENIFSYIGIDKIVYLDEDK